MQYCICITTSKETEPNILLWRFSVFLKVRKLMLTTTKRLKKIHVLQKQSMFYFSLFFQDRIPLECVCVFVFNTCLQKVSTEVKDSRRIHLCILMHWSEAEYHIALFYHNMRSKPMFFHINSVFVWVSICRKLIPHCP